MEVLNLIRLFWGWVSPYISRIHTAYIGEDSSILGTNDMFGDLIRDLHLGDQSRSRMEETTNQAQLLMNPDGPAFFKDLNEPIGSMGLVYFWSN